MLLGLYSCFRFGFRLNQPYSSIIQKDTHSHSEPCVSQAYSEPWHIPIKKHIQTSRYIHNTILNIFTKASSCMFDTVLNAPLFYRCQSNFTASFTLCFRHILAYSKLIKSYLFLLRDLLVSNILLQPYSGTFSTLHIVFRQIQGYLETRLIQARYVSGIFSHIHTVRRIEGYLSTSSIFRQIQAYSKSWQSQTCSCILKHIQNAWLIQTYLEPLTYLASFKLYSREFLAYSEPYLSRFRHAQNSGLFRHVMFQTYSHIFTKLHISRHICPHWVSDIFRILSLSVQKI